MPSPRVISTAVDNPDPHGVQEFFSKLGKDYRDRQDQMEIGNLIGQYQQNRQDANAWEDLQLGLEKSSISPTKRLETQKSLNDMRKNIVEKDKVMNAAVKKGMQSAEDRALQKENLKKIGFSDEEAEVYQDAPASVKNVLSKNVADEVKRGIRKLESGEVPVQNNELPQNAIAPIEEKKPIFVADEVEKPTVIEKPKEEWAPPVRPTKMTPAEEVKWENNNEKENNKELKETQTKKKVYQSNDILINTMQQVNDSKKLPSGMAKAVIDPKTGDLRSEALLTGVVNAETQLYVKNLKQWIKGAKEFFGARVTDFDLTSFMQQLPTLLNSEQGRRVILKQMKYVNDLEKVHNNTLNDGLKHYGRNANYNQIVKEVDGKVAVSEEKLLGKINNLVKASKYLNIVAENPDKFRDHTVMQSPTGEFSAVPNVKVEKLKNKNPPWRDF